jgi:hypothetical protein
VDVGRFLEPLGFLQSASLFQEMDKFFGAKNAPQDGKPFFYSKL